MLQSIAGINLKTEFSYENILEAFLAGSHDSFLVIDRSFVIVTFNDRYHRYHLRQHGFEVQQSHQLSDFFPTQKYQQFEAYLNSALKGDIVKFTRKYEGKTLKPSWYDYEYHPLRAKNGEIIGVGIGVFETTEKNETIEKLRQSEDLFKTLIQNSTDTFQLCNDKFELIFVSSTIKNIMGVEANELVAKNGLEMVHPDEREKVAEWFEKIKQHNEKIFSIEYRVKNNEGRWTWIENYGSNLLQNPNVKAVVMNLRNIQAKKIADFALIQAEQRLSLLLNNTDESFIILNSRLHIVAYNRAAQQHSPFFYTQELQSGLSVLDLIDPVEIEAMIALFELVFEGEPREKETSYYDDKKTLHIFSHVFRPLYDDNNEISGVFITSSDITKRKYAEQQVKESEERFKTIIQESFDAVLITDDATRITYSSPSITNVLGYTTEALAGNTLFEYMYNNDLAAAIAKFAEVIISPNAEKNIDVRMRNSAGQYIWIELKGKNMFTNKYVQGILVSLRDITSRKKAEEIISLSEQRFKGLVQSGADMIWILNQQSELLYASPTVKTIMGIDPVSNYGKSIFEQAHPDDVNEIREVFSHFITSGNKQALVGPYRFVNSEKRVFWVESTVTNLLSDPSINGIVLNSRDVTARRKLTEDLAANTERLKTSQLIAKLGYFEFDFKAGEIFFSTEFYHILGIDPTLMGKFRFDTIEKIIHPEDRERIRKQIVKSIDEFIDFNEEYRIITSAGLEKVILAIGAVVKNQAGKTENFRITLQDITDSKMAIQALETMESRFKSLFDSSIDGIVLSLDNGEIISANPSICKLLGYTSNQITALNLSDLFDSTSASSRNMISERVQTGSFIGEVSVRHQSGKLMYTEVTSLNMTDKGGKSVISTIIRDITDKKKIEEEQKALTEELLRNNQDLQQFSFITSHNMRAPVANLISLLSLYNHTEIADPFNKVIIEKFEEATMQLKNTLNDLVNVLVIKSNNNIDKQVVSLQSVFDNARQNIESLLNDQNGSIEVDFEEVPELMYNKIHLDSIFLNLISNAIRYRSPDRSPVIKIRSYRHHGGVSVSFQDNGLGIDLKRYGDRLFGLYQRFHESKEGKGLGLYMTKSQILAMGGKIEVESEPDKGSIFKVFFKS